jgi:hypothetical protein
MAAGDPLGAADRHLRTRCTSGPNGPIVSWRFSPDLSVTRLLVAGAAIGAHKAAGRRQISVVRRWPTTLSSARWGALSWRPDGQAGPAKRRERSEVPCLTTVSLKTVVAVSRVQSWLPLAHGGGRARAEMRPSARHAPAARLAVGLLV